jgi:phosphopantetheinyl transferase (holo-ACP synthase)
VVDLKETANAGKSSDSRFLKKILTDAEIEYVKNTDHSNLALWSLWACKETAYKVIKKLFHDTAFIPRRWQVNLNRYVPEYKEGSVSVSGKGEVSIRLFSDGDYVHCIGANAPDALDKLTWRVETLPNEEIDPSLFSRHCLIQSLARRFSLDFHRIKIIRKRRGGELQPPCVYIGGQKSDIDISLSHDGRFVAHAIARPGLQGRSSGLADA